jgi:hypothetical protein
VGGSSLPSSGTILWRLLRIQLLYKLDSKSKKVDQLDGRMLDMTDSAERKATFVFYNDLTSAAASISACHTFFPWPKIVAAKSLYRCLSLLKRSAALRKMAARSFQGNDSHSSFAASAPSMAFDTVAWSAWWYVHRCWAWACGRGWVARFPVFTFVCV